MSKDEWGLRIFRCQGSDLTSIRNIHYVPINQHIMFNNASFQVLTESLRLALVETVPYFLLLLVVNMAIQQSLGTPGIRRGLLATLVPNGYYSKPQTAPQYIVANTLANFSLYALLYAVLTFYCWECTEDLSIHKLRVSFPVVAVLWILNFAFTIGVWVMAIRKNVANQLSQAGVGRYGHRI